MAHNNMIVFYSQILVYIQCVFQASRDPKFQGPTMVALRVTLN